MLFNSYIFIFIFLPLCLIGFYLLEKRSPRGAKAWLVLLSLWFYGYFNVYYLAIMIGSIVFNYLVYLWMNHAVNRKLPLVAGITMNLGVLFYFKYFDFFIENCNTLFGTNMMLRGIVLPLGISFFTFQQIGFIADTYRGEISACSFLDYSLFVSFFPQLIAGPIVNHEEMFPQFESIGKKSVDTELFAKGVYIFIIGMAKKVLIADTLGTAVDYAWTNQMSINSTEALLATFFYTLQLYFDFSGYCDMAIGIGDMLGIRIPINFNSPYKATNIVDFWKRWHITLNRFFTKNIYIPLGGNRRGAVRMYINLFLVFLISGLWHGAGWNFILWGCMHGMLYVITRAIMRIRRQGKETRAWLKIPGIILTFLFVNFAWIYFRSPNITAANDMIKTIFEGNFALPATAYVEGFNLPEIWYVLKILHLTDYAISPYIIAIGMTVMSLILVFATPNVHEMSQKKKFGVSMGITLGILLVWCIVSFSRVGTFLYFNF